MQSHLLFSFFSFVFFKLSFLFFYVFISCLSSNLSCFRAFFAAFVPYFPQNPSSYMSFQPLRDVYLDLDILLSFRPEATDGVLLYNGQYTNGRQDGRTDRGDFVCFGLNGAYPEFRFDVGSGPAIIRGQNPLELNRWHTIHLKRQKKNGELCR